MMGMYDAVKQDVGTVSSLATDVLTTTGTLDETFSEVISATAIDIQSSLIFVILVTAVIAIVYARPGLCGACDFYRHCFKCTWWGMPRHWVLNLVWFIMDALTVAAMVHYLYMSANPADGSAEHRYITIFSLFIAYFGFRWFWFQAFWSDENGRAFKKGQVHYSWQITTTIGAAIAAMIIAIIVVTVLVVLFGIQHDFWSMVFMLIVWVWLIILLVWTIMVFMCIPKCGNPFYVCPNALGTKKNSK